MGFFRLIAALLCLAMAGMLLTPPQALQAQGSPTPPGKPMIYEFARLYCPVCAKVEAVLREVEARHGAQVGVRFLYIHKEEHLFQEYRVTFVPTQVFLDAAGKEVWRHEGLLTLPEVEKKLRELKFVPE